MSAGKWVFEAAPTWDDELAVGCALIVDGEEVAACLWASGRLDLDSDGCGIFSAGRDLGLRRDDIDWPSEAEAMAEVWGDESEVGK